jgi:hypothetical protein
VPNHQHHLAHVQPLLLDQCAFKLFVILHVAEWQRLLRWVPGAEQLQKVTQVRVAQPAPAVDHADPGEAAALKTGSIALILLIRPCNARSLGCQHKPLLNVDRLAAWQGLVSLQQLLRRSHILQLPIVVVHHRRPRDPLRLNYAVDSSVEMFFLMFGEVFGALEGTATPGTHVRPSALGNGLQLLYQEVVMLHAARRRDTGPAQRAERRRLLSKPSALRSSTLYDAATRAQPLG